MRAKAALASALWESGHYYPAIEHCREMLQLNPNDNQGIRYLLAGYYLELEMVDDLTLLLKDYSGDGGPCLQYARALLAFRKSSPNADIVAKAAISSNKHVPGLLAMRHLLPPVATGYTTVGEIDEATDYVNHNIKPWLRTAGAVAWIIQLTQ
ncbi:hypothetical protein D3C75_904940 [compost metagenome]